MKILHKVMVFSLALFIGENAFGRSCKTSQEAVETAEINAQQAIKTTEENTKHQNTPCISLAKGKFLEGKKKEA